MKYYLFLTLAVLFWSGNFIFGRYISSDIQPIQLSFFRWLFVFLLLLPYLLLRYKHILKVMKKEYLIVVILGVLGVALFNTFLYYGLQTTTATNALLINSSTPIFIILLSSLILKVSMTRIQVFGVLLSTMGVVFLILKGKFSTIFTLDFTSGDFWIILACIDWAFYSILLKYKPKELNAFDFLSITTLIGFVVLFFIYLYQGYGFEFDFMYKKEVFYSISYMVIFPSILSFYFWNISTVEVGANKAGQFTHLMPIFGAVLAYIFLDEVMELYHLVGIVLIFLGIYLSIFLKRAV